MRMNRDLKALAKALKKFMDYGESSKNQLVASLVRVSWNKRHITKSLYLLPAVADLKLST